MPTVLDYLFLVPSENVGQPDYTQVLTLNLQPYADEQVLLRGMNVLFDVDVAVGEQLDVVGQWIGRSRFLQVPLDIYFSFDVAGLGFEQGYWWGPYEAATGTVSLPDPNYRVLLKATIAANYWDGTIPGAYDAWNKLFAGTGYSILIQDYDDMSMAIVLIGQQPDAINKALFTTGELDLKPAGVELFHVLPSVYPAGDVNGVAGVPLFGFDVENGNISGFDVGAWALFVDSE